MTPKRYDTLALAVADAYRDYLDVLGTTFEYLATDQNRPLQIAQLSTMRLRERNTRVVAALMNLVGTAVLNATAEAAAAAGTPRAHQQADLHDYLDGMQRQFQDIVTRAAGRDLLAVRQSLHQIALRRRLGGSTKRIRPAFMQLDAAGRRRDSVDYLAMLARALIVRAVVETFVYAGIEAGHKDFVAYYYEDAGHRHHGQRFAITARRGVMSYDDALVEMFHANTGAVPALWEA